MKIVNVTGFVVALSVAPSLFAADSPPVATTHAAPAAATNAVAINTVAAVPVADEVLARVNGTEIKRKEVDAALRGVKASLARHGRQMSEEERRRVEWNIVDQIVSRELVLQAASNSVPADLEQRVDQQLAEVKARVGGDEALAQALADAGLAVGDYRRRVRENLIVEAAMQDVLHQEVRVTPDEARAFYDANRARFHQPETVHASHILVRVPADATDAIKSEKRMQMDVIRARLEQGEKFAEVARQVSEDPGSAPQGGDLGYIARGRMVPEFDEAAFTLKTNEVSSVITTQFGYHLLLVTDRKPAREVPFEEAQADIGKMLTGQKQSEAVRHYTDQLRAKANVEVLLPKPPQALKPATP